MTKTYVMARGRILRIQDGAGSVVQVHSGALWVTQEGDGRDYYLDEGSALQLSGSGLALAQATRPSRVSLRATEPVSAVKRSSLGMRLLRFWFSVYAPHARPTTVSL
jgi:Protein of unknown function (DUF2917)